VGHGKEKHRGVFQAKRITAPQERYKKGKGSKDNNPSGKPLKKEKLETKPRPNAAKTGKKKGGKDSNSAGKRDGPCPDAEKLRECVRACINKHK